MITIDWTILLQAVNFFVLLGLLQKLLFGPFMKVMEERSSEVAGALGRVRELEEQIGTQQAAYEKELEGARSLAQQQRAALRQEAAEQETRLLTRAHDEAAAQLTAVRQRIAAEQAEAGAQLRREASALGEAIARKLAGRPL